MKTRQTRYSLYLTVYLLVILAILGATNWLANGHNKSFDSTSNKKFSLSDQTVKVVKGLTKDVTITDYDKTDKFATARDLLDRYSNLSSKLKVAFVDPDKKPQIVKAAGVRSYGQIMVDSGTKKEEAKSLTEEEITDTIREISREGNQVTILIAHRLSTIMHADRIYVLEKGDVVETGNHESLLEEKGLYYAMWRQQIGERKSKVMAAVS